MCDLRVSRCVEVLPGIAAGRAGSGSLERPTAGQASAGRTGSCGHRRLGSCGLRSVLCRSPYETYRLHHNIKAPEYRVIGKPESKLSPQANAAGEQAVGAGGWASGTGLAGMARRGLPPGIASSARRVGVVRTSVGDGLAAQCAVCCLEDSRFRRSRSLPPGKSAPPAQCLACRLEDPRCRQSLKTRSPFIQCPFPALEVCRLRRRCRASPSSGSFCRKWAPNLTSSLNFWAVFGGLFCAAFFRPGETHSSKGASRCFRLQNRPEVQTGPLRPPSPIAVA